MIPTSPSLSFHIFKFYYIFSLFSGELSLIIKNSSIKKTTVLQYYRQGRKSIKLQNVNYSYIYYIFVY